ncbi:MAG: sulfur carrier protein ThiS [Phycisphaerales bacterium]|nr:MAG: sulfur carrier protein ThiS [Phycisphaerales bacterium]
MRITVNGEDVKLDGPCTVAELLVRYNLHDKACAVEVNGTLVTKRDHDRRSLGEADVVEIVTFVGGG